MFLSLMDKVGFISDHFGVKVDKVNDDRDIFNLVDGSIIVMKDAQCTHYYKYNKYYESADASIELRDYFIDKFESQGKIEKQVKYCRLCVSKIAEEMENLSNKEEHLTTASDKKALQDHRDLLDKQSFKITKILSNYTFKHEFKESEMDNDDNEMLF